MKYDKNVFKEIKKSLTKLEAKRESAIKSSREVITLSKKIIYSVHRDELKVASSLIKQIKSKLVGLRKIGFKDEGILRVAYQEYIEAVCYYALIKDKILPTPKALGVNSEDYLLGLSDLSGELVRKAVALATKKKMNEVNEIKDFLSDINYEFLQFNLRASDLRKKADALRWNLKKLEDVVFSASVR